MNEPHEGQQSNVVPQTLREAIETAIRRFQVRQSFYMEPIPPDAERALVSMIETQVARSFEDANRAFEEQNKPADDENLIELDAVLGYLKAVIKKHSVWGETGINEDDMMRVEDDYLKIEHEADVTRLSLVNSPDQLDADEDSPVRAEGYRTAQRFN